MTRRRSRTKKLRSLFGMIGVVAVAVSAWVYFKQFRSVDRNSPTLLVGEIGNDGQDPALQRLISPGQASPQSETANHRLNTTNTRTTVSPSTGSATSRPAVASQPAIPPTAGKGHSVMSQGLRAWESQDLLAARNHLNQALRAGLTAQEARQAKDILRQLSQRTVFSRAVISGDPLTERYIVQSGDSMGKIAKQFSVSEDLLADINGIANKNFIRVGNTLKVLHGPFHATVKKSDHEIHIYLQDVYVESCKVALGINGSTPTGLWKVVNHQQNPSWTNPRTGERWHADDPTNPIGEFWIGLEGLEGNAIGQFGYGIHGTIEPETIGQNVSMGCVRLAPEDIARVYRYLMPGLSRVTIMD